MIDANSSYTDTRWATGLTEELEKQLEVLQVRLGDYSDAAEEAVENCYEQLLAAIHFARKERSDAERVAKNAPAFRQAKLKFEAAQNDWQARLDKVTALAAELRGMCLEAAMLVRRLAILPDDMLSGTENPLGQLIKRMKSTAGEFYDTGFIAYDGTRLFRELLDAEALLVVKIIEENLATLEDFQGHPKLKLFGLDHTLQGVLTEIAARSRTFCALLREGRSKCEAATGGFQTLTKPRTRGLANSARSANPNEEDRLRAEIRIAASSIRFVAMYALAMFVRDPSNGDGPAMAAKTSKVMSGRCIQSDS